MPVRNGAATVRGAIDSVLSQTLDDFEVLVFDDASTDETARIVRSYSDRRIRMEQNARQMWVSGSMNAGLQLARGRYVARMDADDLSLPRRLERQVAFLERNQDIDVLGTWVRAFGGPSAGVWRLPVDPVDAAAAVLFGSPFAHPTVMFRTGRMRAFDLNYDTTVAEAEDWDLWRRASRWLVFANLPEVLLRYRLAPEGSVVRAQVRRRHDGAREVIRRCLNDLGMRFDADDVERHRMILSEEIPDEPAFLNAAEAWLLRLLEANDRASLYPQRALVRRAAHQWWLTCAALSMRGHATLIRYLRSPLAKAQPTPLREMKLLVRSALAVGRRVFRAV